METCTQKTGKELETSEGTRPSRGELLVPASARTTHTVPNAGLWQNAPTEEHV